ncbi:MAG: hypothetical protein A2W99_17515 [Bacteroidetes bacterium GWF2_33_16]|nr:MAG: hypothetical protein A2X00_14655 [Bacteroidetes bacterium GWE2_32_14]OFY06835.1 MAG: hypothetical protein A2W99_17515 [Bacteroidetes bacterium GWF2_33_16]
MKLHAIILKSFLIMSIGFVFGCTNYKPLETVSNVDVEKYMGKWYEISTIPQRFQKGCHCTTAEYTLSEQGFVKVKNSCRKDSVNGPVSQIEGKAFIVKNSNNSKLQVQFFWPMRAKYWIIDLAPDYSYAVVGHPNRKYLWILSRTPELNDAIYQQIINRLKEKDYNIDLLVKTVH